MDYSVTRLFKRPLSVNIEEYIGVRHRIQPMIDSKRREDDDREDPLSATEEVAILRLKLNHRSLSELEEEGVVRWDRAGNLVKEGPHFANMWEEIN